jgi:hypothetical protein
VLYVSAEAFNPKGTDRVITSMATAFTVLPIAAAASAHMTQQAAARFLVTTFNSVPYQGFSAVYFIGNYVARPASHNGSQPPYPLAAFRHSRPGRKGHSGRFWATIPEG